MKTLLLLPFFCAQFAFADIEKKGIKFENEYKLGEQKLLLNGVCLRKVLRFGLPFDVYLGGLYVAKKSSNAEELMTATTPKYLRLVFLRSVDKDKLEEAWSEGYRKNCGAECELGKPGITEFNKLMSDAREGKKIEIVVQKDLVEVTAFGKEPKKIENPALAKSFLRIFIGNEPPTEDCKAQFLGTKAP